MNKENITKKIEEVKKENDKINQQLIQIERQKQALIQKALTNNGKIEALSDLLKEEDKK